MRKRIKRRYSTERWFRLSGLTAISLSILFLAFLLYRMSAQGLGGFTQYEAALPIDFPKSNLMLDPASLRGPEAQQTLASADLGGAISAAATAAYGAAGSDIFGDAATNALTKTIAHNPDILNGRTVVWLPASSKVDVGAKGKGDPASTALAKTLGRSMRCAAR